MGIFISIGTVLFLILCILIIMVILLQSDKSAGMGVLGGASSQSTFGSSTADVITKVTAVMVALFMISSLGLAIMESRRITTFSERLLGPDKEEVRDQEYPWSDIEEPFLEGE